MDKDNVLLQPIKIGPKTASNRFAIQAMETANANAEGNPTEITFKRYKELFEGNAGLIDLEAITITKESRGRDEQLSIEPQNEKALEKFVSELKKINNKPIFIFQLTHSGELSHPSFSRRVCVKPVPGMGGDVLTEEEVDAIMQKYVTAAKIAYNVGADGIDLKFCHGYFGSQVLRPYNDRNWKYGGPWEKRRQFAYDLMEMIKKAVNYDKNFILGSKISMWEGFPGGQGTAGPDTAIMDLTEPLDLAKGLEERGASYILQSAGSPTYSVAMTQPPKEVPDLAYLHFYFSKQLKNVLKPETVVIGSTYSVFGNGKNRLMAVEKPAKSSLVYWGEKNIKDGVCDMVALGRQSLADPYLPVKLETGRDNEIHYCTTCDHCLEFLIRQVKIGCATFDREYIDQYVEIVKEKGKVREMHT